MAALELSQAPPISAPLRFFCTAPLYGVAAGLLMLARAEQIVASRWSPTTLAVVHLLALGVLVQVVMGALLQLLPVAAGATVRGPLLTAGAAHLGLNAGAVLLVAAFLAWRPWLFTAAGLVLAITLLGYLAVIGHALWRSEAIGPTLLAMRLSALGLAVTAGLGFTLTLALGQGLEVPVVALVQVHAAWGVLGFALCVVAGVAYLVVPMFQLTPPYPARLQRALPLALLAGLLAWSAGAVLRVGPSEAAGAASLALAAAAFAAQTLKLTFQRRRRMYDATVTAWRLGLTCLAGATAAAGSLSSGLAEGARPSLEYLAGVLSLAGAFPALIAGMLYKIVPFLVWLHRSRQGPGAPLMHQVLRAPALRAQLLLHAAAVALLALGPLASVLAAGGGLLLALSQALLLFNLLDGVRAYRRAGQSVEAPT